MEKIIVIGAGIGGLASAMGLSQAGNDLTVIEAADAPGGKIRTFPTVAGPVDAGPTVLTMIDVFEDVFERAGSRLDDHVKLVRETCLARHWWPDGSTLDLFADPEQSASAVRAFAGPKAEAQFRAFSDRTRELFDAFGPTLMRAAIPSRHDLIRHVMMRPRLFRSIGLATTMARRLAREFDDPRLRQLFGRYATYVGGSPFQAPAVLRLIAHAEATGVWRVEGGMHRLAAAMADVLKSRGAQVIYGEAAEQIEVQCGRVRSVRLKSGGRIAADRVVFNGDPNALYQGLLGPTVATAVQKRAVTPRSLSAEVWSFAATVRGPDLARHNVFFGANPHTEFDPVAAGNAAQDPTVYVCAQDRGDGLTPPDIERFETIVNASAVSGDEQKDIPACRTRTFGTLATRGVRFSPEPADGALTSPPDFAARFPASQGSLYGRSPHGAMAAFARPTARTEVPGLYLAGGGAHPGAGVPMAALSGLHAAEAILTDRTSTSMSRQTATRGGMSTVSPTAGPVPSRSSPS